MDRLDEGVAFAAIGVAVVESVKMYRDTAPSIADCRQASGGTYESRHVSQQLLDADMLALIVVAVLGGGGAVLIRRWYPLLLAASALLALSAYHHWVLSSPGQPS